jgi:uncharacterized protein (TIGR00255 family)
MAISMTGFGRGEAKTDKIQFTVEVKSINHRYLDISIKMPRKITLLEEWVRQQIKTYVQRGRVELFIRMENIGVSDVKLSVDTGLAKSYYDSLVLIKDTLNTKDDITTSVIGRFSDVILSSEADMDQDEILKGLGEALTMALEELKKMREKEGIALQKDTLERCDSLERDILLVENMAQDVELEYRNKIKTKLDEFLKDHGFESDPQRVLQEAALYADRSSITEEIVRFKTHISQLKETVISNDGLGRKMDFLLQEMNREINTIGSKSSNIDVTSYVVDLKSQLEKVREQIQNIE